MSNKLIKRMLEDYNPTEAQRIAKAAYLSALSENEHKYSKQEMTLANVVELSGDPRIASWATKHPAFLGWFLDANLQQNQIKAWADEAIHMLVEIMRAPMEPKVLTAKDKTAAANLLITLGNLYPSKQKEVTFLDRDVGKMLPDEVSRELLTIKAKLATTEVIDILNEEDEAKQ